MHTPLPSHVLGALVCPHCRGALHEAEASLGCARGHSFDRARQGYVNLAAGSRHMAGADTAEMIEARGRFLAAGWYAPIAEALRDSMVRHAGISESTASSHETRLLVEVGAGTGYYLAALLEDVPGAEGIALDLSKHALRRAARLSRMTAVGADVWEALPLADGAVDVLVDVFAPRNPGEFARVLSDGGVLLTVTPRSDHLYELRERLGLMKVESDKLDVLIGKLESSFALLESIEVRRRMELDGRSVDALVRMGPNAFHLDDLHVAEAVRKLESPFPVTMSVDVSVFSPRTH